MKITNILLVSSFLAVFSAVACSSTATPSDDNKAADDDDDDDDSTSGKPKSGTSSGATTSSGGTTTDITFPASFSAAMKKCETCKIGKDAKYKTLVQCEIAAGSDDAKAQKCFTDAGCTETAEDSVCEKVYEACGTECADADKEAEEQQNAGDQKCLTCVAGNAKAKAIVQCYVDAKDDETKLDACDKQDEDTCDEACAAEFTKCKADCQSDG